MSNPTDQQDTSPASNRLPKTREELDELVARLARLLHGIDQIEVVRARRVARINAAADEKAAGIVMEIRDLSEVILTAAGGRWDTFVDKEATAVETIHSTGGVLKRTMGGSGKLVVEDEERAVAFLKSIGDDPDHFIKTIESVKKIPVKSWLDDNPDRKVPGTTVEYEKAVTLTVERAPLAKRAGFKPHTFRRAIT